MEGTWNPWLIGLSMLVAAMASYVALDLASRVTASAGPAARRWLLAGAASMGIGIWSMHFIGMLAFRLPMPMSYDARITALSLLIAIVVSGFALHTVSRQRLGLLRLSLGGVLMGIGIASMHYTGMAAMQVSVPIRYEPLLFALSIAIAMGASVAALWLAFQLRGESMLSGSWLRAGAALVMGAAICGMHYTGMAAAVFSPHGMAPPGTSGIDNDWLAFAIALFTVMLLGITLLVSLFDARRARDQARAEELARHAALQAELAEHERIEAALLESKNQARAILDTAYEAYVAIDAGGAIIEWNRQAEQTFGWRREEALGRPLQDVLIPETQREAHARGLAHFLATGEGPVLNRRIELVARHRDGHEIPVELTIWPTRSREGYQFHAFLHEISDRRRAHRRLAAQSSAAASLVESASLEAAAPKLLQAICSALGWSFGSLFTIDGEAGSLRCIESWDDGEARVAGFAQTTRGIVFERGVGLPGRIWSSGQPAWVPDVACDANFPRAAAAREAGLHAAFGFPVLSHGRIVAVLEFMSHAIQQPDPELLGMMDALGSLLGQFIARVHAEKALEQEDEFLTALLDNITEGIVACDERGMLTVFNRATRELHGLPEEPLPPEQWAEHYDLYLADGVTRMATEQVPLFRALNGEQVRDVEMVLAPKGRARHVVTCNGRALFNRDGEKLGAVVALHEITALKENERSLRQLAHFDPLTGLPNRRLFRESLESALGYADEQGWLVFVLFLDLDNFKGINDSLGHTLGDELLRLVARRLLECLRPRDTIARLGGDEFGVILLAPNDVQIATRVAEKLLAALRVPFEIGGHTVSSAVSIGITVYPNDSAELQNLVRYADLAMYEAKQAGRNTYRFYTEAMNVRAREKLELESALRRALENREFALHYQPKASLATGRWTGVEALLRWHRPGHGLVPPNAFIPTLEETGLIVPVGAWAIAEACQQARAWEQAGIGPLPIAVNVSAHQVSPRHLPAQPRPAGQGEDPGPVLLSSIAAGCLREQGLAAGRIEFELTESTLMSDAEHSVDLLRQLKTLGIPIFVDDFGTGYSSLPYLRRFPLDALKIDGAFVRDLSSDEQDASIILAIIGLAHRLRLQVIAECVETAEQRDFLRANGCDQIQGYLVARPMPAEELERAWKESGGVAPQAAA